MVSLVHICTLQFQYSNAKMTNIYSIDKKARMKNKYFSAPLFQFPGELNLKSALKLCVLVNQQNTFFSPKITFVGIQFGIMPTDRPRARPNVSGSSGKKNNWRSHAKKMGRQLLFLHFFCVGGPNYLFLYVFTLL